MRSRRALQIAQIYFRVFLVVGGLSFLTPLQASVPTDPKIEVVAEVPKYPGDQPDRFIASHNFGCSTFTKTYETFYGEPGPNGRLRCKKFKVEEIFKRCRGQDFPLQVIETSERVPMKNCASGQKR